MGPVAYLAAALLVLAVAFLVFRVAFRRDYRRRRRLTPLSTLLGYVAIGSWACFGHLNQPPDWPAIHVGAPLRVAGWILLAGGAALSVAIIVGLGIRRSHGHEVNRLKQSGFYRVSRNPQVVAFLIAMVGYGFLWPTWPHAGSLAVLAGLLHMMVLTEEEHLRDVFGAEYEWYLRQVPRYLGPWGKTGPR